MYSVRERKQEPTISERMTTFECALSNAEADLSKWKQWGELAWLCAQNQAHHECAKQKCLADCQEEQSPASILWMQLIPIRRCLSPTKLSTFTSLECSHNPWHEGFSAKQSNPWVPTKELPPKAEPVRAWSLTCNTSLTLEVLPINPILEVGICTLANSNARAKHPEPIEEFSERFADRVAGSSDSDGLQHTSTP